MYRYRIIDTFNGAQLKLDNERGELTDYKEVQSRDADIARLRAELAKAKEQVDELEWRQSMIDQTGQRIRDHAERAGFDFPDMDDEVGAMADSLIAMRAELDAAKKTLARNHRDCEDAAKSYPGIHGESFSAVEALAWYESQIDAAKADCEFYKSGWADLQAAIESEYDHGGAAGFTTLHKIIRDTWKMRDERNAALAAKENPNAKA